MCKGRLLAPPKPVNHLLPSHLHKAVQLSFVSPIPARAEKETHFKRLPKIISGRTRMEPLKLSDFTAETARHFRRSFIILPCQKFIGQLASWSVKELLVGKNKQGHPSYFTKSKPKQNNKTEDRSGFQKQADIPSPTLPGSGRCSSFFLTVDF